MTNSTSIKGYTKRPLLLVIVNVGYLVFPLINLFSVFPPMIYFFRGFKNNTVQISFISGFIVWEQFVLLFVLSIVVAILLYWMNKISWWAVVIHSGLILFHNIFIFVFVRFLIPSIKLSITTLILSAIFELGTITIIVYFVIIRKQFREIFFNKRLRWWESKTRYLLDGTVDIILKNGDKLHAKMRDVSIGGICAVLTDKTTTADSRDFKSISFKYGGLDFFSDIVVIWEDANKFGLYFSNYDSQHKKRIKKIIAKLRKSKQNKEGR